MAKDYRHTKRSMQDKKQARMIREEHTRPTIKFSHQYDKLFFNGEQVKAAELIQVLMVNKKELTKEFLDYDTNHGQYKIRPGDYLLLLFKTSFPYHVFTTLRPAWSRLHGNHTSKMAYYQGLVGRNFHVVLDS